MSLECESQETQATNTSKPNCNFDLSLRRGPTDSIISMPWKDGSLPDGEYLICFDAKEEGIQHKIWAQASVSTLNFTLDFDHPKAHSIDFDVSVQGIKHEPLKFKWISQATVVAETQLIKMSFYPIGTFKGINEIPKGTDKTYVAHLMGALDYLEGLRLFECQTNDHKDHF